MPVIEIQQRLRAWRESLPRDNFDCVTLFVARRGDRSFDRMVAPHCAELLVNFRDYGANARVAATQLGEVLRVVALTTAPHVDPLTFNVLWDADGVCTMGASPCARCDDADRVQEAVVHLFVYDKRSGARLLHDAIFDWDERAASAAFTQLRDALRTPDGDGSARVPPPSVELHFGFGHNLRGDDDDARCLRGLQTLLARAKEPPRDGVAHFRIARLIPTSRATDVTTRHCAAILTTLANSGVVMQLKPWIRNQRSGEEYNAWRWLLDWAEASRRVPRIDEVVVSPLGENTETLVKLLDLVVTRNAALRHLTLAWPLSSLGLDANQRRRAVEAIGAALFAPDSSVHLQTLEIRLGDLTDDDVAALERGAGISLADASSAAVRFDWVKWAPQATSEACIGQVARLLGAVGVRQLEIESYSRGLPCHTLKAVLQSCPLLTRLWWCKLLCDDFSELEKAAWRRYSGELRELRLSIAQGDGRAELRAMDALLGRVDPQLATLILFAEQSALSGPMADAIVVRCPRLRELNVTNAKAQFHETLVDAFDTNRCKITSLTVHSPSRRDWNECGVLLASLMEPTRGASRWLRSFGLGEWTAMNRRQTEIDAFLEVLASNLTLQRVRLYENATLETRQKFKVLPLQFVVRLPPMRRQLALMSVCGSSSNAQYMPKLPPDVLRTIFEFSGRRVRRFWYVGINVTI